MSQNILLVDDEEYILNVLKRIFRSEGYQVYTASSGEAALKILKESPVQVIISDQNMPEMTGAEFLSIVKKKYPDTTRIILSAYTDFDLLIEAINDGAIYKFLSKPWDDDKLKSVVREAFLISKENKDKKAELEKLIDYDPLTGLQNRFLFRQTIIKAINTSRINHQPFGLVILELVNFSRINTAVGEENGDEVLKIIANRLKSWVKFENHITRFGYKFNMLIENISTTTLNTELKILFDKIHEPIKVDDKEVIVTVNIGISFFPEHGNDYDTLLTHATNALIKSIELGVNTYKIFDILEAPKIIHQFSDSDIYEAIQNNQFILHYQPIVTADNGVIKCAEALIRWQHPTKGVIPPNDFIPFCEANGLMILVGNWVLEAACRQLKKWNDMGHDIMIAVNISQNQLRDQSIIPTIKTILEKTNINPKKLELEITESVMMHDLGEIIEVMQQLSKLLITLSMDDFGTGYSSLSYLKYLPFNYLKIDKSFIDDLTTKKTSIEILTAIISLAKILGMTLIAEGVETLEQLTILRNLKCDLIQGYYFSKAVPVDEFNLLLKKTHL